MASADGGRIWIGVAPDGQTVGVQVGKGTMEDLANKIAQNTNRELKDLVVKGVVLRHGAGRSVRYVLAGAGGKQVASNGKQVASDRKVPS